MSFPMNITFKAELRSKYSDFLRALSAALQVAAADHAAELAAQEQRGRQQLQATLEAEQQAHATRTEGLRRAVAELTEEAAAHQLAVSRLRGEPEALSGCSLQEVRALPRFRHIA